MSQSPEEYISSAEIKQEFQVERMILFSDAVFAIVITLMAIEIRIPESAERMRQETLLHELKRLMPTIFAYLVSFFFIGSIWYQHLRIFSLVKNYDKGLVVRNLALLFLVGLFPFSASVITRSHQSSLAFFIYLGVIYGCMLAQYFLHHYIVIKKPSLRVDVDIAPQRFELKKKRILLVGFSLAFLLCAVSYYWVEDPTMRSLIPLWILPVVFVYRWLIRKGK